MQIKRDKLYKDHNNKNSWTRVYFSSDDLKKETILLVCVLEEYLEDRNLSLDSWIVDVIERWKSKGDDIFKEKVLYDAYADTNEDKIQGLDFLRKKIKP